MSLTKRLPRILICDDDQTFQLAVKFALKGRYDCRSAHNSDEAAAVLKNHEIDLLLLDIQMRTPEEGLEAIPTLLEIDPDLSIVMSSGRADFSAVREAMRRGAADYIVKSLSPEELEHTVVRALDNRRLKLRSEQQNFEAATQQRQHTLAGSSRQISALRRTIEKLRQSPANILITGETGTGKEIVARMLRRTLGDSMLEPFVAVDSATIQGSTAESLLFGHEKGAFTGADQTTKGVFEEANGGIVYFDEIANMPLEIQAKLLRVLQEKEISRMGSPRTIQLEFRVIAATNRDLEEMVRQGQFKDDLFQRLNVLPIQLSPLRERADDIPGLVEHFLRQSTQDRDLRFTSAAMAAMKAYSWPGNVRELGNLIAYVSAMVEADEIDADDLPPRVRGTGRSETAKLEATEKSGTFYLKIATFERQLLTEEYSRHDGNIRQMALSLGMDRSHLYTKLREYGIHPKATSGE